MGARENLSGFRILLNSAWTSACLNGQVCQHSLKICMLNNALDLIRSSWPMLDCFNLSLSQCRPKWYYFCYCSLQLCWGNECCLGQWSYWRYLLTQLQWAALSYLSSLLLSPLKEDRSGHHYKWWCYWRNKQRWTFLSYPWDSGVSVEWYFTIGLFWGLFRFFYWLIRGSTGIWVRIRPPEQTRTWSWA